MLIYNDYRLCVFRSDFVIANNSASCLFPKDLIKRLTGKHLFLFLKTQI